MNNQIFNAKNLFQLPKDIILEYENKPSPFGFDGLGEFIYHRTYSRVKDGSSQTETWPETVYRVVNGNYSIQKQHIINSGLPWDEEHGMRSAREMYDRIFHMKFLPPGRGLWASGTDITDKKGLYSALNNCGAVSTADIANIYDKPFRFIMDMLMLGVGMGFDTKGAGTIEVFDPAVNNQNEYQLPKRMRAQDNNNAINVMNNYKKFVQDVIDNTKRNLANETDEWKKSTYQKDIELYTNDLEYFSQFNPYQICTHVVEDTREGWVNATGLVIRSHMQPGHYPVVIDYSKIRPAGILLKTFGGKSSGPEPLLELHCMLRKRIIKNANGENASNDNSSLISHTTITDIVNLIAKCVVAGNIRRSATISMGPYDSAEFMDLKDYSKNPDRIDFGWCSNNSILGKLGMDYEEIAERIKINGEPGIAWFENVNNHARMNNVKDTRDARAELFNPCAEQPLSSFELCCLVEIFPNRHESIEDFLKTIKYAYLYGKSVTLGSSHWPETNRIQMRNRRIGTSLSGVTQFIARHSMNELREWCLAGYDEIQHWDEVYSEWLCVPRSNRTTTIKPSGTVSLLAGSTPGAHYPQAKHYIRRVRLMNNSEIIPMLAAAGYKIEPCIGSEKTTVVVEFPVKIPEENLKTTSEVSMWQKLELAAKLQEWWSDNSVSVTIDFDAETEGDQIADALDHYQYKLKSVSFLPRLKETTAYPQMPYETITEEQYNEMMKDIEPLVLTSYEKNKDMEVEIDNMCDGDKCLLK